VWGGIGTIYSQLGNCICANVRFAAVGTDARKENGDPATTSPAACGCVAKVICGQRVGRTLGEAVNEVRCEVGKEQIRERTFKITLRIT
jgi:hypothetical protein